tara:strand:+ start:145 stop:663 length:519 start_codon:yes stop_codon:yes gene_type:complete
VQKDKDIWDKYESRIDNIIGNKNISLNEVAELFEIGHAYNMQRKLIPEKLSDWMKEQSDKLRLRSASLYKRLGIDIPTTRPTDGYTMSMVVSDIWKEIFMKKPILEASVIIGKRYDVDSSIIIQNFMKHWSAGLDYHLVLRMKELSPLEMDLAVSLISPIIAKNKLMSDKLN